MSSTALITVLICLTAIAKLSDGQQCSFNLMCSCKTDESSQRAHLLDISCVGVPLSKLPDFPRGNVSSMAIVGSGLEIIMGDSFGDMKTHFLSLTGNNIVSIHDLAFMVMYKTLEKLDLSSNNLQEIPIESLLTCQKLKTINLESNEISSLRIAWKHIQDSLTTLHIGGNDLYGLPLIPEYSLSSFQTLVQIYLDRNFLTNIESNALPFGLQLLSASENLLSEMPTHTIDVLQSLTHLYLKHNFIINIPTTSLSKKKSLVALDISHNLITTINNIYGNSIQIKDLNLQSNNIETIHPLAFNGLSCTKLDLSNNKLSTLSERAFYGLEYTLEHLDLSHNKLSKIPKALLGLKHLKILSLDYNDLPGSYPDNFLKNCSQSIRSLSLMGNAISSFPKNIFKQTKKITFLNLGYNDIDNIDENDFLKWGDNLETLILSVNSITKLGSGVFKHLKKLVELNLSYNKIAKLDNKAFQNLEHIKTLDISYGLDTNEFPDLALKTINSLIYLALSGNNITVLPKTGIYDLSNLQYFILDFNRVSSIPENFFHTKVHKFLKDIRLSYNQLSVIEQNTFNGLEGLHYIILNDNNIDIIHQGAFKNIPNTLTIILSYNLIDKITAMSFVNIPNFVLLDLSNNLLQEFSFNIFHNVTSKSHPMTLNLSRNSIENVYVGDSLAPIHVKVLDLSHNKLTQVPPNLFILNKDSLRRLDLSSNLIRTIEDNIFENMKGLQVLSLKNNLLLSLKPFSFLGLTNLQILDISHNHLEVLNIGQFKNMQNLRILDISYNSLRSLPTDIFHNTKLERLIAKNNVFVLLPSLPFIDVSYTLRVIDFSFNQIEQIGRQVFSSMPLLNEVNLCYNRLIHAHSNDFKSINTLIKLKLCGNKLPHVRKDLFQQTPSLKYLNLAETNIEDAPLLQIPNLVSLNLSHNHISHLPEKFVEGLPKLRHLDLSYNNLTALSGIAWSHAPSMKSLHLSYNPLKILTKDSLSGLLNLNHLNIQNLPSLERFDSDTLSKCKHLKSLKIQTWPKIEKYKFQLPRIIVNLRHLKRLSVMIAERKLSDQLHQAFPKKLQYLEITGKDLEELGDNSLEGIENLKEFHLRISGTSIKHFPKQMFWKIKNNKFTLDISNNLIDDVDPEVFYAKGGLKRHGTHVYSGNINVEGNPLVCGCNTQWFGKWMRRYLVESMKINANKPEFNQQLKQGIKQTMCTNFDGKLIQLLAIERVGCRDILSSYASNIKSNDNICLVIFGILISYIQLGFV